MPTGREWRSIRRFLLFAAVVLAAVVYGVF